MVIEFNIYGKEYKLIPTKFGCDIFCNGSYNNTIIQEQEYDHAYWIGRGIECVIQMYPRLDEFPQLTVKEA